MTSKQALFTIITFFTLLLSVSGATAQEQAGSMIETAATIGTGFTYQGMLTDGGAAANGNYDFEFGLYDAPTGGSQVGPTITVSDLAVSDGLFTVELDFGDIFDGTALWLNVEVRPGSSTGAYTTLSPRQNLTPAPYALGLRLPFDETASSNGPAFRVSNSGTGGGMDVSSSNSYGVYGLASSSSGGSAYGIYGQSNSTSGRGVYGTTTATTGTNYGVYGRSPSTSGVGVYGLADAGSGTTYGVYGSNASTSGRGVYGLATAGSGTTFGVYGESRSSGGIGVMGFGTSSSDFAYGVMGQSNSPRGKGVYGIAAATSGTNYGVYGRSNSPDGYGVYATNDASNSAPDLVLGGSGSQDNGNLFSDPDRPGSDLLFYSNDEVWVYLDNNDDETGSFQIRVGGGTSNPVFRVDENGNVFADGTYNSPAADFAEMLSAMPDLAPGDVLVIGPDGRLARSTEPYQPSVVGVYATRPGYLGGGQHLGQNGYAPLAVVGVVPVKVSAENGPIQPGDLLTTSSTPGYAMKASPIAENGTSTIPSGVVIGKALEGLEEGTGVISMLVMLQ